MCNANYITNSNYRIYLYLGNMLSLSDLSSLSKFTFISIISILIEEVMVRYSHARISPIDRKALNIRRSRFFGMHLYFSSFSSFRLLPREFRQELYSTLYSTL